MMTTNSKFRFIFAFINQTLFAKVCEILSIKLLKKEKKIRRKKIDLSTLVIFVVEFIYICTREFAVECSRRLIMNET